MTDSCSHLHEVADVTGHFTTEHHPTIQSYEPGEDWWWCYIDEIAFLVDDAPSFEHP